MTVCTERNPLSVSFWKSQGVECRHTIIDCRPVVMIRTNPMKPFRLLTHSMWMQIEGRYTGAGIVPMSLFDATREVLMQHENLLTFYPHRRPKLCDAL